MSLFDLGRGRGGVAAALGAIEAPLTVVGIDSDRLFPVRLQQEIVDLTPGADRLHLLLLAVRPRRLPGRGRAGRRLRRACPRTGSAAATCADDCPQGSR